MSDVAARYREDGYVIVRGVFSPDEMAEMAAEADKVYAVGISQPRTWRRQNVYFDVIDDPKAKRRIALQGHWVSWLSPILERYRRDPRYLDILAPLLGADIKQFGNQIHWKPPGAERVTFRYHQDYRFLGQRMRLEDVPDNFIQTILAIDPQTAENGALKVFPGSHRLGYLGLSDEGAGYLMVGADSDDYLRGKGLDPAAAVTCEMAPGDLILFHPLMVHGSGPNHLSHDRRIYLNGYVRAAVTGRGEWAFRDGRSVPLGPEPSIVKYDDVLTNKEVQYFDNGWAGAA